MMIPIRCFTCNNIIAHKWEKYKELVNSNNLTKNEIFSIIEIYSPCCKTMFLTSVDIIDELLKFPNNPGEKNISYNYT